jgi:hypothetical protein
MWWRTVSRAEASYELGNSGVMGNFVEETPKWFSLLLHVKPCPHTLPILPP